VEIEDKQIRIAVCTGLIIIGSAFMSRFPQLLPGQQAIPWYQSGFFWAGIVIAVIGLLILIVPPKRWKRTWQSVLGFPTWLRETYIWKRYGPVCTLGEPEVTFALSQDGQTRIYTANVSLLICLLEKNKNYYPVRVAVNKDTTIFYLGQKRGLVKLCPILLELLPGTIKQILLDTPDKTTHEVVFSQSVYNNPSITFIDIQQSYEWIIDGIEVHLANITKFRKLSKRGEISNVEKA